MMILQLISFWLIITALFNVEVTRAAHSRRRVVVRREAERYDRSITTFSEDGSLAQVEYGMEASLRGSTIAGMKIPSGICILVQNSSFGKVHRLDHHLWLITAGLSGDARVLADTLRTHCQKHRMSFGEAPTTKQIARVAGELQHKLTRTSGARPLGCTAIVAGIDASPDGKSMGKAMLFQTDPGGIVEECSYCAAGKERDNIGKIVAAFVNGKVDHLRKLFSEFIKKKPGQKVDQLSTVAASMTEKVLNIFDQDKKGSSLDLWIIRPNPQRRGGMQTTCYRNIRKDSVGQIGDQQ
jgi:20S proteasome alpha/beta subunit